MAKVKEDWELALLEKDNHLFGGVKIVADGYNISYTKSFNKNKSVWMFYIDGTWKGVYSNVDNEIGQKFGNPKRNKMSKDLYALIRLNKSKYLADKQKKEYENKVVYYHYCFSSATQIIKILKQNCKDIKLLENE